VGPFEEEEEETGTSSDVIKVKGEDPATPGYYLRSADTRKPRDHNGSPISIKQSNTHCCCNRSCCTWRANCVAAEHQKKIAKL